MNWQYLFFVNWRKENKNTHRTNDSIHIEEKRISSPWTDDRIHKYQVFCRQVLFMVGSTRMSRKKNDSRASTAAVQVQYHLSHTHTSSPASCALLPYCCVHLCWVYNNNTFHERRRVVQLYCRDEEILALLPLSATSQNTNYHQS